MICQKYARSVVYAAILFVAVILFVACGLKPFSAVQVKASPELSVPLGSKTFSAADFISLESFETIFTQEKQSGTSTDKRTHVYRYSPENALPEEKDQLRYLIRCPIETLDLNISTYFDENSSTRKLDSAIPIPKINKKEAQTVDIGHRVNEGLLNAFNNDFGHTNVIPIPPGTSGSLVSSPVTITFQGFKTLTFSYGSMTISTTPSDPMLNYEITKATMKSNGAVYEGMAFGSFVHFDLNDDTIDNKLELTFTITVHSGSGTINVKPELNGSIKRATGINTTINDISLGSNTIDVPLGDDFYSAIIKTGSLSLSMKQPEEWHGITIKEKTVIKQSGVDGLLIDPVSFQQLGNTKVDLAGQKLNKTPYIVYETAVNVSLINAVYTYQETIPVDLQINIEEFDQITLKNRKEFTKIQKVAVPAAMKNWIKSIDFNDISAKVVLNNGLPQGNSLKLKLLSTVFDIPEQEHEFAAGKTVEHQYLGGNNLHLDVENTEYFDVSVQTLLPGHNELQDTFTLRNIQSGTEIKFSGQIAFDLDWKKMEIKTKNKQKGSFPQQSGKFIDVSAFTKLLKQAKIKMDEMPMYFYFGSPLFDGKQIDAKLAFSAEYMTDAADMNFTPMPFIQGNTALDLQYLPPTTFPSGKKEFAGTIPQASLSLKKGEAGVAHTFSDLINSYPQSFRLNYELSLTGFSIDRNEYETLKKENGKVQIRADLLLDIPIGFTVEESGLKIPLKELADGIPTGDIFGRKEPWSNKTLDTILKSIRYIEFNTQLKTLSGLSPTFILQAKDSAGNDIIEEKRIKLGGDAVQNIRFTRADWQNIAKTVPFSPDLYLAFESGKYRIKKTAGVEAKLSVLVAADIDYTFELGQSR